MWNGAAAQSAPSRRAFAVCLHLADVIVVAVLIIMGELEKETQRAKERERVRDPQWVCFLRYTIRFIVCLVICYDATIQAQAKRFGNIQFLLFGLHIQDTHTHNLYYTQQIPTAIFSRKACDTTNHSVRNHFWDPVNLQKIRLWCWFGPVRPHLFPNVRAHFLWMWTNSMCPPWWIDTCEWREIVQFHVDDVGSRRAWQREREGERKGKLTVVWVGRWQCPEHQVVVKFSYIWRMRNFCFDWCGVWEGARSPSRW